jgi:hypothetical protein
LEKKIEKCKKGDENTPFDGNKCKQNKQKFANNENLAIWLNTLKLGKLQIPWGRRFQTPENCINHMKLLLLETVCITNNYSWFVCGIRKLLNVSLLVVISWTLGAEASDPVPTKAGSRNIQHSLLKIEFFFIGFFPTWFREPYIFQLNQYHRIRSLDS